MVVTNLIFAAILAQHQRSLNCLSHAFEKTLHLRSKKCRHITGTYVRALYKINNFVDQIDRAFEENVASEKRKWKSFD